MSIWLMDNISPEGKITINAAPAILIFEREEKGIKYPYSTCPLCNGAINLSLGTKPSKEEAQWIKEWVASDKVKEICSVTEGKIGWRHYLLQEDIDLETGEMLEVKQNILIYIDFTKAIKKDG